jgi:hypothetical protein
MYCPRCAAQNLDDAKFCRGCGTSLETIALALSGHLPETKVDDLPTMARWIELRRHGLQQTVRASGLLGASLLIGAALGLFSNTSDWIIIWLVFVGWMACWGVISLVSGIGSLIEANFIRKQLDQLPPVSYPALDRDKSTNELLPDRLPLPLSVTENTTRSLVESRPASKSDS